MAGETKRLAAYAVNFKFEDIPADVLAKAKNTISDTVSSIIFGYDLPWSQIVVNYATVNGRGGKSQILGKGAGLATPGMAALANGALAHAFELDGGTKPSAGTHPCATIFPAVLALAQEKGGVSGREVLAAYLSAAEVVLRIGTATKRTNEARGFHAPSTTGSFASAVGSGRILGLDVTKMSNAIGIAGSLASGLVQFAKSDTGSMVKRLHFGRANESGVLAASLASQGYEGPHDVVEGELGFLRAFCDATDPGALLRGLGETYMTLCIYMKRYACHGSAQAPLQALQELQAEHKFTAADVESIVVNEDHEGLQRHHILDPGDPLRAQYSIPFCLALAFFDNPKDPRAYSESNVRNPEILAVAKRVTLVSDVRRGGGVTVKLKGGRTLTRHVEHFRGTPGSPADQNDVYEKFTLLTNHCPRAKMDEIYTRIQNLEKEPNMDWLKV